MRKNLRRNWKILAKKSLNNQLITYVSCRWLALLLGVIRILFITIRIIFSQIICLAYLNLPTYLYFAKLLSEHF